MLMFETDFYYTVVAVMLVLAVVVFFALHRVEAAYGMTFNPKWGPSLPNRIGWILMESPVVAAMGLLWAFSPRAGETAPALMAIIFLWHYLQRSFIFPFLIRGKSRMPLAIILMGVLFNLINAYMIGGWIFYVSPADMYASGWLVTPQFIIGTLVFFVGMFVNMQSDSIIRNLRKPGDTGHYIPRGGMFRYVTSANYLGELMEWTGYAILTWSLGGLTFALWTFANLAPRARTLHARYIREFGDEYASLRRSYIIPRIY